MCGAVIQETDQVGDNAEDVDADLQRAPISSMHNLPSTSVAVVVVVVEASAPKVYPRVTLASTNTQGQW